MALPAGFSRRTNGRQFDGETIQMGIPFEMALASLGSTPGCDDPIRTALPEGISKAGATRRARS